MPDAAAPPSPSAVPLASPWILVAFGAYVVGVFVLGYLSHRLLKRGSFVKEYFLGDRKLNAWVLALTYVATSVSAGSFVGFPSLIYRNGWVLALWIAGYMVAGLVTKGVLAKRLNQVSRLTGAVTVPDVLRDRFRSPALGLLASGCLLVMLSFNLVAQFKAGGFILQRAGEGVRDTAAYRAARSATAAGLGAVGVWNEGRAPVREDKLDGAEYPDYVLGVLVFALTVVLYTTYGGFWAVTWTDVLQAVLIVTGALLLMGLALWQAGGLTAASENLREINPKLLAPPGPDDYLALGLAVSFFFQWTIIAMAQPVGMVRLMACPDTPTLRRSLFLIGVFYALIYLPLVVTFVCARSLYPTQFLQDSDRVMPAMALTLTQSWPLLGGLILAAPYAAAMSAVAGFLLLMSSSLVRDVYQRSINPNVSPRVIKRISYATTAVVGILVTAASLWPPRFLQYVIVFTTAALGCAFLAPTVLGLYWRRATRSGALAAMASGVTAVVALYVAGWLGVGKEHALGLAKDRFAPFYLLGLDPLVYGLVVSFGLGIGVSLATEPPPAADVDRYFLEAEPPPKEP
jgi:sodium/pantothenate symporter